MYKNFLCTSQSFLSTVAPPTRGLDFGSEKRESSPDRPEDPVSEDWEKCSIVYTFYYYKRVL